MVFVRLLGPIEVVDDSGVVRPLGSALRRTLLALLAMHPGEVLSADWLLEHGWGGEPPESGSQALRFHISRLRRELGDDDLIETHPGGYRLAISADHIDALAVEAKSEAARSESDPSLGADMYAEVLAMWHGSPLVDAAPTPMLDDEAARLSELRLTITEDFFRCRIDAGTGRELVADLSRLTSRHPLREALWSMLIVAQYRAGLQADALDSYEQMRAMLVDSLGLDPSDELKDLQRRVLQHDPMLLGDVNARSDAPARSPLRGSNLPAPATALIDSDDRLGVIRKLILNHRLVTLSGTGGVGKTRLAVELGWSCLDQFEAGVWMVELAPVAHPDAVMGAVASTLSIRLQQGLTVIESIVDWFHGRELLLILDNCEHVLDAVRELATAVLARSPTVKVVATSREPLNLAGERVYAVSVLSPEVDGVALFVDRATAADSSFVLEDAEREVVTDICRRLDGLPLAIELAAARVRSMAPVDLVARLDDRFKLLRGGSREGPGRHETLQATVQWSYRLLTEAERAVFDRLSVFAGGFDLRAAELLCRSETIDQSDVVDLLRGLVDKSMIVPERHSDGVRFRILESLRQFGEDQLELAGGSVELRERHLRQYVGLAEEADDLYRGSEQSAGVALFDREWDNLRRAHEWASVSNNLPMAERLISAARLFAVSRMRRELGDWVERTLALGTADCEPTPDTFAHGSFWADADDNLTRAWELNDRGIELLVAIDDPAAALCLSEAVPGEHRRVPDPNHWLEVVASKVDLDREWWILIQLADRRAFEEDMSVHVARLVETAERIRAPLLLLSAALWQGHSYIAQELPDYAAALERYGRALAIARESGDLVPEADSLRALALVAVGPGRDDAIEWCREALIKCHEIRLWHRTWQLFESIALALALAGSTEAACVIAGHLEAHHPPSGFEHRLGFRARTLGLVREHSQGREWMAQGAAMERHQVIGYASAALEPAPRESRR